MIRKFLMASTAVVALTGSAFAADLPSRRAPPVYAPPVPIFTWTGIYVGGHIGYAWGKDSAYDQTFVGLPYSTSPSGVIGGAHVGYNWQVSQWVFGLEGDIDGTSLSKSVFVGTSSASVRSDIQGSIRGRVGIAWDRVLIFATGGGAFANFKTSYSVPGVSYQSFSKTRAGWTVGGGIEYAVTNNWSVRAEYRYSDFGRSNDWLISNQSYRHSITEHQVKVGFSYKFDLLPPPGPVVAKY
jgi:outer membrane immunogenic protein